MEKKKYYKGSLIQMEENHQTFISHATIATRMLTGSPPEQSPTPQDSGKSGDLCPVRIRHFGTRASHEAPITGRQR